MRDATEIERRGTPAVAVVTQPFRITAASMAARQGYAGAPFVVIEHPLASLDRAQIRLQAAAAAGEIAALLSAP